MVSASLSCCIIDPKNIIIFPLLHRHDKGPYITLFEEVYKHHGPPKPRLHGSDPVLSQSHSCPLMEFVDLSSRPQVPTLADFTAGIERRISSGVLRWHESECGREMSSATVEGSGHASVTAQWSCAFVRSSEMPYAQVKLMS